MRARLDCGRPSVRGRRLPSLLTAALTLALMASADVRGQTPAAPQGGPAGAPKAATFVIGGVAEVNPLAQSLVVRTDGGELFAVLLDDKTVCLKVPATDQTPSVEKGVPITLADVGVGDRVLAHMPPPVGGAAARARRLLVMSKADILEKQEQERARWHSRGMSGTVVALDPAKREISIAVRAGLGAQPRAVIIEAAFEGVEFLRYAPGSVKFADARPSSFDELKVGDQLRALGEKSPDGSRFKPEKIMSGAFRTVGGTVTEVDPVSREIKVTDLQKRQQLIISVSADAQFKRLPPEVAARLGQALNAAAPAGAGADFQAVIERLPAADLAGLKPGDVVVASTASGAESSHVVAAVLVAGVEPLLNAAQPQAGAGRPAKRPVMTSINFGIGLP